LWITMIEVHEPGVLAAAIELELERFRRARLLVRMPASVSNLAEALARIVAMLHEADERGQAVDLGEEVVRLLHQFRGVLCAVGGAPAQA
jgi:aminoglycoside phosphotransferase family enzyme